MSYLLKLLLRSPCGDVGLIKVQKMRRKKGGMGLLSVFITFLVYNSLFIIRNSFNTRLTKFFNKGHKEGLTTE